MSNTPTPRPWGYVHHKGLDQHLVGGVLENVAIVEDRHGNAKENAEFIVKAVNSHDALVAALKLWRDWLTDTEEPGWIPSDLLEAADAALEKIHMEDRKEGKKCLTNTE